MVFVLVPCWSLRSRDANDPNASNEPNEPNEPNDPNDPNDLEVELQNELRKACGQNRLGPQPVVEALLDRQHVV